MWEVLGAGCTCRDWEEYAEGNYPKVYDEEVITPIVQICDEKAEGSYILVVLRDCLSSEVYGESKPPERDKCECYEGWKKGYELTREWCPKDEKWYWVKWKAKLLRTCSTNEDCGKLGVCREMCIEEGLCFNVCYNVVDEIWNWITENWMLIAIIVGALLVLSMLR